MDMLQRILDRAQTVKEPSQKQSSVIEEIMETDDNFDHLISQNHKTTEELGNLVIDNVKHSEQEENFIIYD